MKRNVIGTAKEGTRCLYYTWIVLNKSGGGGDEMVKELFKESVKTRGH